MSLIKRRKVSLPISIMVNIIASAMIALSVKIFISPNRFVSTGVTGIALLFGRLYDNIASPSVSLETTITGILYFIFNIPLLILAYKKLSRKFAIVSLVHVLGSSLCLSLIPDNIGELLHLSVTNGDISFLDAALFAGLFSGTANALSYIFAGSTGGIDILSMYFSVKKQKSVGKITTIINCLIIIVGIFVDGGNLAIAKAFYTLVYIVISSIMIDLFYVRNRRKIIFVTTSKGDEITSLITNKFVRGVTKMHATGGFTGENKELLYSACLSFEVDSIVREIKDIDEHAFISIIDASKVYGNFISKELQ